MAATASRLELLSRLDVALTNEGVAADAVVDDLAAAVEGGLTGSVTGRFFGGLRESTANEQAYDPEARRRLWALSEEWTGSSTE